MRSSFLNRTFIALFILFSFDVLACNCGRSVEGYFNDSKSVHLLKVTELNLIEQNGESGIEVVFEKLETLSISKKLPEKLFLRPGGCTPSLMPGFKYVVFIPKKNRELNLPKEFNNKTIINSCTGIFELGYLNHPKSKAQYKSIKEKIVRLEKGFLTKE